MDAEEFFELAPVYTEVKDARRTTVFEFWVHGPDENGVYWGATVALHPEEGVVDEYGIEPYPVERKEVTVVRWEAAE